MQTIITAASASLALWLALTFGGDFSGFSAFHLMLLSPLVILGWMESGHERDEAASTSA